MNQNRIRTDMNKTVWAHTKESATFSSCRLDFFRVFLITDLRSYFQR